MTASKIVIDKVTKHERIKIRYNTSVTELHGENKLMIREYLKKM